MRIVVGLVIALAVVAGCAEHRSPSPLASQALLSSIGTATALQHESDVQENRGEIPLAIAAAERILDVPFPTSAPEREDIRLDAYGRIAELELARGDVDAATARANAGLGEATRDSYFRARLHVVLGRAHEMRSDRLRDAGDDTASRTEAEAALDELEESIRINRVVLDQSLRGAGPSEESTP